MKGSNVPTKNLSSTTWEPTSISQLMACSQILACNLSWCRQLTKFQVPLKKMWPFPRSPHLPVLSSLPCETPLKLHHVDGTSTTSLQLGKLQHCAHCSSTNPGLPASSMPSMSQLAAFQVSSATCCPKHWSPWSMMSLAASSLPLVSTLATRGAPCPCDQGPRLYYEDQQELGQDGWFDLDPRWLKFFHSNISSWHSRQKITLLMESHWQDFFNLFSSWCIKADHVSWFTSRRKCSRPWNQTQDPAHKQEDE